MTSSSVGEFVFLALITCTAATIRPMVLLDSGDMALTRVIGEAVDQLKQINGDVQVTPEYIFIDRFQTSQQLENTVCSQISDGSMWTGVIDMTSQWISNSLSPFISRLSLPISRIEVSNGVHMRLAIDYLRHANASDAVIVFQNAKDMNHSVSSLLGRTMIRLALTKGFNSETVKALRQISPSPLHYIILADGYTASRLLWEAESLALISKDSQWMVALTDMEKDSFFSGSIPRSASTLAVPGEDLCCLISSPDDACPCLSMYNMVERTVFAGFTAIVNSYRQVESAVGSTMKQIECYDDETTGDSRLVQMFQEKLITIVEGDSHITMFENSDGANLIGAAQTFRLQQSRDGQTSDVGIWNTFDGLIFNRQYQPKRIRRHFRVGVINANPWTFLHRDANGRAMIDNRGHPLYAGYCIDLLKEMAIRMDFEFELVFPSDGAYGIRDPTTGVWNGLVGELARKETDMIIAPLSMTSEREEVIDFVAPYFDQSGISIVVRQREPDTSLFRFLSVLRLEVWLSVLAALTLTGIMIWLLDRLSPYSGQNTENIADTKYRIFTVKESFWFALTSFTPQGGGEAPRAISGRTLVAAYWLFVVLMLATFTANLAAFLTVERLQTTVKDLEELGKQSRIVFTTVANTSVQSYFSNMAHAESSLFSVWKNMTLGAGTNQARYRVWDYPIKEQFKHLFDVIRRTGMVANDSTGFDKVREDKTGSFALILDSSIIRYEVNQDCNLTQIGQPFAQQPYAIAVQEGSRLKHELSQIILDLQKDRFFEMLTASYWNSTYRSQCPSQGDSEGITLQSLGGVFIATLAGLTLAVIALVIEVLYYRNKNENEISPTPGSMQEKIDKTPISAINFQSNVTDY